MTTDATRQIRNFRPDVEGMRAIAVIMVLLYHVGIGLASGGFAGVDVFFVISGFLITGLLVKEIERTGSISLMHFYARRAKRLFPAAATVLVATAVLAYATLPVTRWRETGGDLIASALYFVNWRLAQRSVDYLAEDSVPSFAQHFWSLAVEEQYYIVWPVVLVVAFTLLRRHLGLRTVLWGVLAAVALPSFIYSLHLTQAEPGKAYFVTTTRMWELAIGGAVALGAPIWARIPAKVARAVAWAGLAMVLGSLLIISTKTPWPGYAAALPTLGAAAVIIGGYQAGHAGPVALLGTRPFVWIGGISYSLYLWHWPLIEAAKAWLGQPTLSAPIGISVVGLAVVLAWLTWNFIENPIRFSRTMDEKPQFALGAGLAFSMMGAMAAMALMLVASGGPPSSGIAQGPQSATQASGVNGALSLPNGKVPEGPIADTVEHMAPRPENATLDVPQAYADGCQLPFTANEPKACYYGAKESSKTIALVGDSKALQWLPALELIADKHSLRILVQTKSACGFSSRMLDLKGKPYQECYEWNRALLPLLLGDQKPDFLFTSLGGGKGIANEEEVKSLLDWWQPLSDAGVKVVAIANNPNPGSNVYECVAKYPTQLSSCAFARGPAPGTASLREAAARLPTARYIDLNDAICSPSLCPPVIGNALLYRQGSHLTRTYVLSLAPLLETELVKAGVIADDKPRGFDPAMVANAGKVEVPALPHDLKFTYTHAIDVNRIRRLKDGTMAHRIRLKYFGISKAGVISDLTSRLQAKGFHAGRSTDQGDGKTRMNLRRAEDGLRVAVQVTELGSDTGELYLSFVAAGPAAKP